MPASRLYFRPPCRRRSSRHVGGRRIFRRSDSKVGRRLQGHTGVGRKLTGRFARIRSQGRFRLDSEQVGVRRFSMPSRRCDVDATFDAVDAVRRRGPLAGGRFRPVDSRVKRPDVGIDFGEAGLDHHAEGGTASTMEQTTATVWLFQFMGLIQAGPIPSSHFGARSGRLAGDADCDDRVRLRCHCVGSYGPAWCLVKWMRIPS